MRFPVFSGVALYLTLAVLREREGLAVPVSDRWKIFSKKLRKNLVVKKKPLTFANAFADKRKLRNKK